MRVFGQSVGEVGPSPALRTLARLPFKLILTTHYDQLLERALEKANRDYTAIVQPEGDGRPSIIAAGRKHLPWQA